MNKQLKKLMHRLNSFIKDYQYRRVGKRIGKQLAKLAREIEQENY